MDIEISFKMSLLIIERNSEAKIWTENAHTEASGHVLDSSTTL